MATDATRVDTVWLDRLENEAAARSMENSTRRLEHRAEREISVDPDELLTLIGLAKVGLKARGLRACGSKV